MKFGDLDQGLGSRAGLPAPLLPLLESSDGNAEQRGEPGLRKPGLFRCTGAWKDPTVYRRPIRPALISRMPARISRPISRVFSQWVSCFLAILGIVNVFHHLSQNVRRDVLWHIVCADREQPEFAASAPQAINDPQPAALAATLRTPAQLLLRRPSLER